MQCLIVIIFQQTLLIAPKLVSPHSHYPIDRSGKALGSSLNYTQLLLIDLFEQPLLEISISNLTYFLH